MNERVMEILNLVLQKMFTEEKKYNEQEMVENLLEKGYELSEIDAAFDLIFSVPELFKPAKTTELKKRQESFRVFSLLERSKLSLPVQDKVLHFFNRGFISEVEMEMLLMEMMLAETGEITLKHLNTLLTKVIKDEKRLMMMIEPGMIGEQYEVN